MIKNEIRTLLHNKLLLAVIVAIILIPSIYAGIFLSSMWNPYGDLKYLPVAVVNLDRPVEYEGKELAIGRELTDSLVKSDTMDFRETDADTAGAGLKDGTYYMVITIPEDFSHNASTLTDEQPQKMVLDYATNPGNNYISMKLGESAMEKIRGTITSEVTRTYADAVFHQISGIGDGMQDAADGSKKLLDGTKTLKDGNETITRNLELMQKSTLEFQSGMASLKDGVGTYTDGVQQVYDGLTQLGQGTDDIASGTDALLTGGNQLLGGLSTMRDSLDASLTPENVKNLKTAEEGLLQLNDGISQLNTAVNGDGKENKGLQLDGLTTSITDVGKNLSSAAGNLTQAGNGLVGDYAKTGDSADLGGSAGDIYTAYMTLAQLLQSDTALSVEEQQAIAGAMKVLVNPSDTTDANTALGKTLGSAGQLKEAGNGLAGAGTTLNGLADSGLTDSVTQLKQSVGTLAESGAKLLPASSQAITSLRTGMEQMQTGLEKTKETTGESGLLEGMTSLCRGLGDLKEGVSGDAGLRAGIQKLQDGAGQLVNNSASLNEGAQKLTDGAAALTDGSRQLTDGSRQLGDGIDELQSGTDTLNASLQNGADTIRDSAADDQTLDMFSEPVTLAETKVTDVKDNGHAMAAYMMSVGLWVGCLAFCLMYPLTAYAGEMKNGLCWWSSKAVIVYPVAILMAAVLLFLLHLGNGFAPADMGQTFLTAVVTVISFMSIMYFFNVLLGKVGSFLMLIFMVLQLAGSAGTYPVEISGPLAELLHPYVPFTYSVQAFRSAIAGAGWTGKEYAILLGLALIFTILTIIVFWYRGYRIRQGKQTVHDWLESTGLA